MSKTIEVKGVFDPSDLRESSKKLQSAIEQDAALSNSTIEEAAQLLEFAGLWFEQNQDKIYTTVGADGNPPAPSKIDNSQRDVAAGPVPADQPDNAQACITRPDLDELEFQRQTWLSCSGMNSNSWQFYLAQQLAHTITYIQHLEHQLTVAQNQNNLSLTTLRAERDKLLTDKQILDALEKSFAPVFLKHNINVFQIRAAGPYGVDPHGFNVEDHKSVRHALSAFLEIELQ